MNAVRDWLTVIARNFVLTNSLHTDAACYSVCVGDWRYGFPPCTVTWRIRKLDDVLLLFWTNKRPIHYSIHVTFYFTDRASGSVTDCRLLLNLFVHLCTAHAVTLYTGLYRDNVADTYIGCQCEDNETVKAIPRMLESDVMFLVYILGHELGLDTESAMTWTLKRQPEYRKHRLRWLMH